MRVYELAKKLQTTSNAVLERADKLGIETYSPLSQIEEGDVSKLSAEFAGRTVDQIAKEKADSEAARAAKLEKLHARRSVQTAANMAELSKSHQLAIDMAAVAHGQRPAAAPVAPAPKPAAPVVAAKPAAPASAPAPAVAAEKPVVAAPAPAPAPEASAPAAAAPVPAAPSAVAAEKPVAAEPAPAPAPEEALAPAASAAAAAKTAPVPAVKKAPKPHYEDEDEELDELPSSDRGRIAKELSRDSVRPPRAPLVKGPRERGDSRTSFQTGPQRSGFRPQPPAGTHAGFSRDRNNRDWDRDNKDNRDSRFGNRAAAPSAPSEISPDHIVLLRGAVIVKELAEKLGLRPNRLIADLMQMNILASINQHVDPEVAERIAKKYGFRVEIERQRRSTDRKPVLRSEDADDDIPADKPEDMVPRPPVITFLGHVDHGKTSLMDRIRHTKVAAGEAGGITQHMGAYTVDVNGRKITFLDTPGHAAFSQMRIRGANLTDIAVIVIAADDGIMPQTKEAIADARQAGVQMMIAINKCDLPTAKPDRVRQMLQGEKLTPEEWGGDIICCEVSAITGAGIDHLLEMILLQADMLELTANPKRRANGHVIEAQLEQGLGPTATLLVTGGTLNIGDILLCGEDYGKVRSLIDDRGHRVKSAGPSTAVKCTGLSGVPEAGAAFRVMLNEKRARDLSEKAAQERRETELANSKVASVEAMMKEMSNEDKRSLAVIVKADTQGSSEAICEALREITSQKVSLNIISESIGNISATDINNAAAGHAIIVGFDVGCEAGVQQQARHDGVRISTFRIIYELIDHVKKCMLDLLPPEYKEVVKGHADVIAIFDIGKLGKVAGCRLTDGTLIAKGNFRVFRKKEQLWNGKLTSLKHFQNEAAEVSGAQECGIHFNGFEGFQEGDTVECFVLEEKPKAL